MILEISFVAMETGPAWAHILLSVARSPMLDKVFPETSGQLATCTHELPDGHMYEGVLVKASVSLQPRPSNPLNTV